MPLVTDPITYNVHERGRKFRGRDRNFDTALLAKMINGSDVQEKVKHGDMLGYFGHWPRVKFGMATVEGGIDKESGKAVSLPMAVRTVELSATPDGTITHREEFLDTEAGHIAEGLYKSKAGGFSSAIDAVPNTTPYIPRAFHGFDYVYEPNYSTNRGHKLVLDSIGPEMAALLDQVIEHAAVEQAEMVQLFDSLHAQHERALDTLERISNERDLLVERLASASGKSRTAVLDGLITEDVRVAPTLVLAADLDQWTKFRDMDLVRLDRLPDPPVPRTAESEFAERKYNFRR
ncbi:MAG: hypothetical protein LCH79_16180 [Proteobacteria bacterium]|nr:hypothetical protein [Pseudomonadota bacterium]